MKRLEMTANMLGEEQVRDGEYILCMDVRGNGNTLEACLAVSDYSCVCYDIHDCKLNRIWDESCHGNRITDVKYSDNLLYTSSIEGMVKSWDTRTSKMCHSFKDDSEGSAKPINCFDISPNGRYLCCGTELVDGDAYLVFWDVRKGEEALGGYWEAHTDDVTDVAFGTKANNILTASSDGLINLFDISKPDEEEALTATFNIETSVREVMWTKEGMACVTDMETMELWSLDGSEAFARYGRSDLAHLVGWEAGDTYVGGLSGVLAVIGCAASGKEELKWMDVESGIMLGDFQRNQQIVRCVWHNDDIVLTAGEKGIVNVWRMEKVPEKVDLKMKNKRNKKRTKPYSNG